MLMVLPAGALIGLAVAAAVTRVLPKIYESEAIIEPISGVEISPEDRQGVLKDIKSPAHLSTVANRLGLPRKWRVDEKVAVGMLTESVNAGFYPESDLVFIRVRHADKKDACDIAREVVAVYGKFRADAEDAHMENSLSELKAIIAGWEEKVSANRRLLEELRETTASNLTVKGTETLLHI